MYLEDIKDRARIENITKKIIMEKHKPIVILKSGISNVGKINVAYHTGAVTNCDIVFKIYIKIGSRNHHS